MSKKSLKSKKWEQVTDEERQYLRDIGVLNGFGGSGQSFISRWLIGLIIKDFNVTSADKHDFSYWKGQAGLDDIFTNEFIEKLKTYSPKAYRQLMYDRRKNCDEKFYQHMLLDIYDMYMEGRITKSQQVGKSIIALLAWCAIRLLGWKYFDYNGKTI